MIAFDLQCSNKHNFEGWFKDLESFSEQNSKGMITCPVCRCTDITRILSPVSIKSKSHETERAKNENLPDYNKLATGIVNYIKDNFDDVGTNFAKEALKIHYGVAEKRDISGSATVDEEQVLKEEGVKFFKVPFFKPREDEN